MEKIRFIYLEDVEPDFEKYSTLIKEIFEDENIKATQLFSTYNETHNFMILYQDYKGRKLNSPKERAKLDEIISQNNLKSNDLIYFIDDNWENDNDTHDGTDCFRDFLYKKTPDNSNNAIVLTGYTRLKKFGGMKYLRKNDADKNNLSQEIQDTSAYRKYIKAHNNGKKEKRTKSNGTNTKYEKI